MSGNFEFRYLKSTARRYSGALICFAPDCDFLISIIGDRNSLDHLHKIPIEQEMFFITNVVSILTKVYTHREC